MLITENIRWVIRVKQNLIVIEELKIAAELEASFTEFYHHEYLPEVCELEGIRSINRYEEYGTQGSLAWFDKSFITTYDISLEVNAINAFEFFLQALPDYLVNKMNQFEFKFFFRDVYELIFSHPDISRDNYFANGPFFVVTVETEGEDSREFHDWYENKYLPETMADIPVWDDCKRYQSVSRIPVHYHTIYRAANMIDLQRGFDLLRAPYRYQSNADWDNWVGQAISKQNAASFQQIYHKSK